MSKRGLNIIKKLDTKQMTLEEISNTTGYKPLTCVNLLRSANQKWKLNEYDDLITEKLLDIDTSKYTSREIAERLELPRKLITNYLRHYELPYLTQGQVYTYITTKCNDYGYIKGSRRNLPDIDYR